MTLELLGLPFFQRALLVGLLLGGLLALLGVLVVLRRLSFFADAIGHSALTGIAIGLLLGFNPFVGAVLFAILVALGIVLARRRVKLPLDTVLGVSFPAAVAIGVLLVQRFPGYQTDLVAWLFGDILTVGAGDVVASVALAVVVVGVLVWTGKSLLTIAVSEDLAHAEGIAVVRHEILLLVMLAAVIALAIKLVGIVLVTAMLVIPAATAQNMARSLSVMFAISVISSIGAVVIGMVVSAALALPSGPTVVLVAAGFFLLSLVARPWRIAY